jgi:TRAP-type mannitol/chloroaromatic compound transport system substrate-binding protein
VQPSDRTFSSCPQATFFDFYINLEVWNAFSEQLRATLEVACGDAMRDMMAKGEAAQWSGMEQIQVPR